MDIAIYKITNTINGKFYFGQTVDPKRRWRTHKYLANKGIYKYKLYNAMQKYRLENFTFEVVHWCEDKATADEFEKFVIAESGSKISGYNTAPGGEGAGSGKDHPAYRPLGRHEECVSHDGQAVHGERVVGLQTDLRQRPRIRRLSFDAHLPALRDDTLTAGSLGRV